MNFRYQKHVLCMALVGLAFVSCSSSHDDEIDPPVSAPTTEPVNNDKFGLQRQDVLDHFSAVLKGGDATFTTEAPIEVAEIDEAKAYVWDLWRTAVRRAPGEKLPTLSSHYKLSGWDEVVTPDANWAVPEGQMAVFYGSKGTRPADGYPLFLFLHGSGSDANGEWTACLYHAQSFADGPSAYFLPRSPQGGTGTRWFQPSKQEKWEQMLRIALTQDNIDPRKIYFAGISEGAYGSQRLASFYADYLAGAGPIAGGEFLANCPPENLANIAFTLQTGALDANYGRATLTARVDSLLNGLAAQHPGYYEHKVELQEGRGHACDYYRTTPWLINYSRNAIPKYFAWENFGMGDINNEPRRYRDTFYNLQILEPSDDRSDALRRTAYEMNIAGNTVNITVNNVSLTETEPMRFSTGQVNVGVSKSYTPATTGRLRVYLNNDLVDLSQPVTINVNGAQKFSGTVTPSAATMVESCRLFFDPLRVFPAAVEVSVN